jgi:hypothetical protein
MYLVTSISTTKSAIVLNDYLYVYSPSRKTALVIGAIAFQQCDGEDPTPVLYTSRPSLVSFVITQLIRNDYLLRLQSVG